MFLKIHSEIQDCLSQSGREKGDCEVMAVSKTRTLEEVLGAYQQGARHFGENYVQEGFQKEQALPKKIRADICWHLIGPLQSNKAKIAAQHFDWVQSVSSLKLMSKLAQHRDESLAPLNICIQVNIDQAPSKNGVAPDKAVLMDFMNTALQEPRLVLRGLMVIPDAQSRSQTALCFEQASALFKSLKSQLTVKDAAKFDTLSMGMSGDYQLAIEKGSTMVRIGTAVFGAREKKEV